MELGRYQREAWRFDQHPGEPDRGLTIALLGLGGEVGSLQTTLKKIVRDGPVHVDAEASAAEDLGDVLWYIADTATWLGVDLSEVASANLDKIKSRWVPHTRDAPSRARRVPSVSVFRKGSGLGPARLFDSEHIAVEEQLPRRFEIHVAQVPLELDNSAGPRVLPVRDGKPCGNIVGDNSYVDDGYRYHDALHLAHLAVLGWSPVVRALLRYKRKAVPIVDDVEDGGRAVAIEEGITAFVFGEAARVGFYESTDRVDGDVLRTCQRMTAHLEVAACTPIEWENAILAGFASWRSLRLNGSGALVCDLDARTLVYRAMTVDEHHVHRLACALAIAEEKERRAMTNAMAAT